MLAAGNAPEDRPEAVDDPVLETDVVAFAGAAADILISRVAETASRAHVFALCLEYGAGDDEWVLPPIFHIGLAPDREAALSGERTLRALWLPHDQWTGGELPFPRVPETLSSVHGALGQRLLDAGVPNNGGYVNDRIARELGRREWPGVDRTEDFVAFAYPQSFPDDLLRSIRFAASPESLRRLEDRGYLGLPETADDDT